MLACNKENLMNKINVKADSVLKILKQGNQNFINKEPYDVINPQALSTSKQSPMAVVLGCSDSRVPVEMVFNQGLGRLFVVRVAGNIVAPSQLGSIEFAVARFGVPLVVVLGHSNCGAIEATIDALNNDMPDDLSNIGSIVKRIKPVVAPLMQTDLKENKEQLMAAAVRANIDFAVHQLCHASDILKPLVKCGELMVVGAQYDLASGQVEFFDD